MRHIKLCIVFMLIPIITLTTAFKCGSESQLRKAAKASHSMAGITLDAVNATREAFDSGVINLETKDKIAKSLGVIIEGQKKFGIALDLLVKIDREGKRDGKITPNDFLQLELLFSDEVVNPFIQLTQSIGLLSLERSNVLRIAITAIRTVIIAVSRGFGNAVSKRFESIDRQAQRGAYGLG